MRLPFGLEESFGKKILKLEFTNLASNPRMKMLYNLIQDLENKNRVRLNASEESYKSCIYQRKKYAPLLVAKLPERYGQFICQIINSEENPLKTIYELKAGDVIIADVTFERLWRFNKAKKSTGCIVSVTKILCV